MFLYIIQLWSKENNKKSLLSAIIKKKKMDLVCVSCADHETPSNSLSFSFYIFLYSKQTPRLEKYFAVGNQGRHWDSSRIINDSNINYT